jgi:hypothetical protein
MVVKPIIPPNFKNRLVMYASTEKLMLEISVKFWGKSVAKSKPFLVLHSML